MNRTRAMIYCALFAALIAVMSQLSLPIGPVPISMATFGVMLCGAMLGWKYGAAAVGVYLLLGLTGVPVFAGFRGGAGVLAGATGGYLIGYLPCAMLSGLPLPGVQKEWVGRCLLMEIGTVACYALGTLWFMHASGSAWWNAVGLCVAPFLPGDAAKIVLVAFLTPRLRKAIRL